MAVDDGVDDGVVATTGTDVDVVRGVVDATEVGVVLADVALVAVVDGTALLLEETEAWEVVVGIGVLVELDIVKRRMWNCPFCLGCFGCLRLR